MSATPRRVENLHTDKGKVPVYATGIVEQPWDDYSADDHATWATLYARQREVLPDDTLEPPAPDSVPVLWNRPDPREERGVVLPFRRPDAD